MTNSNSIINKKEQQFRSLALLTLITVYLVILAGGVVRGTGSGMGCPDWPKCFGHWIPPTDASQLPPNYQEIYGAKLKGEIKFNAVKTWIEYINRLLGVLSGFFVLATLITSFKFVRSNKAIFWGSVAAFLLIGVNGWLGSKVVATELAQYMITIHLLLAILVVFALLIVIVRSNINNTSFAIIGNRQKLSGLLLITMCLTLGQVLLGTFVREALDDVVKQLGYDNKSNWINSLGLEFYIHRSFSIVLFALHIGVIYAFRKQSKDSWMHKAANWLILLVIAEILTGVVMAYMDVPAAAQPIHLLVAMIMVGLQFVTWLSIVSADSRVKQAVSVSNLLKV